MKALVLTSDNLRHQYFLKVIQKNFDLRGVIVEDKGDYYSKQVKQSLLIKEHFEKLRRTEIDFFKQELNDFYLDSTLIKKIKKNTINDDTLISWAESLNVDIVFLFGTGILNEKWLDTFKNRVVNIHLGLAPFYRGSATLFWPFVNDELTCVGATIHLAVKQVDAGNILARVRPKINVLDNYYTVNYKTIKQTIELLPSTVKAYIDGKLVPIKQETRDTRVYKKSDFNEGVLKEVLDKYGNGIGLEMLEQFKKSAKCNY